MQKFKKKVEPRLEFKSSVDPFLIVSDIIAWFWTSPETFERN